MALTLLRSSGVTCSAGTANTRPAVAAWKSCPDEKASARANDEALADPATLLGADRDVLQVRVGRGQPSGRRDHLVVGGVDPAVDAGHRDQGVHDALEL